MDDTDEWLCIGQLEQGSIIFALFPLTHVYGWLNTRNRFISIVVFFL